MERHPYQEFDEEDIADAKELLKAEMKVVQEGMGHPELSLEQYSKHWEDCLNQVVYLPTEGRYTRTNAASKKERMESLRVRLEFNNI